MELRALVTLALSVVLTACSDDGGGGSTGNLTSGTGPGTTTGDTTTGTTPGSEPTSGGPTSGPGTTTTTGEPATTTGDDTTSTTGASLCDGGGLGPGDHTVTLEHGGLMRSALVHVPTDYDPQAPTPVVLNFHGFTQTAAGQQQLSGMNPVAEEHGFVVVYPEGVEYSWNAGLCCGQAVLQDVDDVGFVRALVARLHEELCVDAKRVYAAGMSNGGYISHRLACEATDLIAAVAPVSATIVIDPCTPSRPIAVQMFNGTTDLLVPYNGGIYQSAPQSLADWVAHDNCSDEPDVITNGGVTCETYDECDAGVSVSLCTIEGMGHCWPGNPACPFGTPNEELDASEAAWNFFQHHSLP